MAVTERRERNTAHESKRPEKYEGGRTVTGSRLFEKPTVLIDDARKECDIRQQDHRGHYFNDNPKLRLTH